MFSNPQCPPPQAAACLATLQKVEDSSTLLATQHFVALQSITREFFRQTAMQCLLHCKFQEKLPPVT